MTMQDQIRRDLERRRKVVNAAKERVARKSFASPSPSPRQSALISSTSTGAVTMNRANATKEGVANKRSAPPPPPPLAPAPSPMRRVQSAQDVARYGRFQVQQCCYDKPHRLRYQYAPVPAPPMRPRLSAMSKNSHGATREGRELMKAKATNKKAAALYGSWSEIRV